jgi:TonB-linked SusC/RagA family outer membrane protein
MSGYSLKPNIRVSVVARLKAASSSLDDVVILGYQSVRRPNMLAAASSVGSKDIRDNPLNSVAEVLQGRLAGVQITMSEGAPGADPVVNVRGRGSITQNGDPLYVVDGIPIDNALSTLNPQDIESITVLKDAASTAIYGSRGANGVVVITTKGGKNTNGRTIVTYNSYYGVQKLAKEVDMMKPYDFVLYQYERAQWTGDTSSVDMYIRTPENYDTIETYKQNPGVDWQKKTMGRDAFQMSQNLSITGGNATTTYNLSLTYNTQNGVLINSYLKRKIANFRFEHKASEKFRFGFNMRYTDQFINGAGTSDASGAGSNNLRQFTRYRPLLLPGQDDNSYDVYLDLNNAGNGFNIINPILLSNAQTRRRYTTVFNINGFFQYNILSRLSFRSTSSYNINTVNNRSFDDTITTASKSLNKKPFIVLGNTSSYQITNSNVLTYSNPHLFNTQHALNILVGQEIQKTSNKADQEQYNYFPIGTTPDQAFDNIQLAAASSIGYIQPRPSSSRIPTALASFFSTVDYNYDQRFLAKFTLRADGTSIFSEKNRWGYFPSGALAWRLSNEKFFTSKLITDLKVRYSLGTAGNNRITPFSYRDQYSTGGGYGLNNALNNSYNPSNLGNESLVWENQVSQDLGVDLSLWNGRVSLTVDAYSNKSKHLLLNQTIPASTGYTTQYQNIGATRNRGIETQISAVIVNKKDFSYNASFNISFNKNKITSLGPNKQILRNSGWFSATGGQADYLLKVGEEVGSMYGYINDGFYKVSDFDATPYSNPSYPQYSYSYTLKPKTVDASGLLADVLQPGSPKFRDINGDGKITPDSDRVVIGHAQPKFFGGLSQMFRYKNFDLSVFINFSYGNQVFNANKLEYASAYGNQVNLLAIDKGRWKMIDPNGVSVQRVLGKQVLGVDPNTIAAVNENAKIWFPSTSVNGFYPQSYAVEDGSYIRINNVTLGYTIPRNLLSKAKISSLRFYVTANNLAMITHYTGYDPDASTRRSDPTTPGVDYAAYPRARTFVGGLNLTF